MSSLLATRAFVHCGPFCDRYMSQPITTEKKKHDKNVKLNVFQSSQLRAKKKILSDNAIMLEPPTWSNGSPWRPFLYRYKNNFRKRNAYRDPNTLTRKSGHGTSLSIELALNSQDLPKHLACPTFGGRWNQMVSSFFNLHGSLRFEATALWLQVLLLGWWCHLSHPSLLVASSKEMGSVDRTDGKVLFECYLTKQLS